MSYRLELINGCLRQVPVAATPTTAEAVPASSSPEEQTHPITPATEDTVEADVPHLVDAPPEYFEPEKEEQSVTSVNARELQKLFDLGGPRPGEPFLDAITPRQLASAMTFMRWRESKGQLRISRCAMAGRLARCDGVTARRILHAWHIVGIPSRQLSRMNRFLGMLFLPSNTVARFAAQPALVRLAADLGSTADELFTYASRTGKLSGLSDETAADLVEMTGAAWTDLTEARVLLLVRGQGDTAGSWSLRAMSCWLDEETHQLVVGGTQPFPDGQKTSHVRMIEYFGPGSRLIMAGAHTPRRPPWSSVTVHAGLDLAYAMELAVSTNEGSQQVLEWPRVWIGFAADADVSNFVVEHGEGLLRDTVRLVKTWLARGRPDQPTFLSHLRQHEGLVQAEDLDSWDKLATRLGPIEAGALLDAVWLETTVRHDGLTFLPLDYFRPGSPQKPLSPARCRRVLLAFGSRLMGREIFHPDGSTFDPLQARAQVLAVPRPLLLRDVLHGATSTVRWDFRTRSELRRG